MEYEQQEANHFIGREYVDIKIFNAYDTVLCCLHSLLEVSDFFRFNNQFVSSLPTLFVIFFAILFVLRKLKKKT